MDTEPLRPIAANDSAPLPAEIARGRAADVWAFWISVAAFGLALIAAIWFLAGFLSNDPQFNPAFSAFLLTAFLGAFALGPPLVSAVIARRARRAGLTRRGGAVILLLFLPWVILGGLLLKFTPLPAFVGLIATGLAGLLCIWAGTSLWLDRK